MKNLDKLTKIFELLQEKLENINEDTDLEKLQSDLEKMKKDLDDEE